VTFVFLLFHKFISFKRFQINIRFKEKNGRLYLDHTGTKCTKCYTMWRISDYNMDARIWIIGHQQPESRFYETFLCSFWNLM